MWVYHPRMDSVACHCARFFSEEAKMRRLAQQCVADQSFDCSIDGRNSPFAHGAGCEFIQQEPTHVARGRYRQFEKTIEHRMTRYRGFHCSTTLLWFGADSVVSRVNKLSGIA